jgi:hypothetical protein
VVGREVRISGEVAVEAELKHTHSCQMMFFNERFDVGGNLSQIFRYDRLRRKPLEQRMKKMLVVTFHPFAVGGGFVGCGDLPVSEETPEMVNPDCIEQLKIMLSPLEPPAIPRIF